MRPRTRLTAPPGQEPAAPLPGREQDTERYAPGFRLPEEPPVPGRLRWVKVAVASIVVLAAVGYVALRLAVAGQAEDPALDRPPSTAPPTP
ncbi:MAG TPA: hypothetical protein VHF25_07075 [Nitriliruptorales bacterium]|nr:hypothetical protein [Nitriliruptorales bacterium]